MKRFSAMLGAAALLGAAACSDATKVSAPSSTNDLTPSFAQQEDQGYLGAHLHVMPVKSQAQEAHSEAGKPGSGSGMIYHGGPVLQAGTNVAAVYWASSTIFTNGPTPGSTGNGSQDGSLVGYFLNHIGGSPYFDINTTYTNGSGQAIVNSVSYTQYWANNTGAPSGSTKVSDAQMIAMLQSGFDSHALLYDPSTLYAIFTSGNVNLGGGFGSQYCAYHTNGTVTINGVARTVLYAAMPYNQAYPGTCTNGTPAPNGDAGADAEVNTLVHEIEETTTDMLGTAWWDRRGYENADKCAWTWGSTYSNGTGTANVKLGTKDFLIQQNWKNSGSGGCAMHL